MKRNPLWDAQAKQHLASGNTGPMLPNALSHQALPGVGVASAGAALGLMRGRAAAAGNVYSNRNAMQEAMARRQSQMANDENSIRKAYMDATGREADAEGLQAHMQNPGGARAAVQSIFESPEAAAYRERNPLELQPQAAPMMQKDFGIEKQQGPQGSWQDMAGQATGPMGPKGEKMPPGYGNYDMGPQGPVAAKPPGGAPMSPEEEEMMLQAQQQMRGPGGPIGRGSPDPRAIKYANRGTPFQYRIERPRGPVGGGGGF